MKNLAKVFSAELEGIHAQLIEVEVDIHVGLHAFNIVGLADKSLSEAKERVNSALKNSDIKPPNKENRKITVNLAPADVKKTGSQYDLAIAVGYLLASQQIKEFETKGKMFVGELSLEGTLRGVNGALNIAELAKELGFTSLFLPAENAKEASILKGIEVIPVRTLTELIAHLEKRSPIAPSTANFETTLAHSTIDISEIKGQENAKRALMIAAAGGHNMLMVGPPGSGKSILAQSINSIVPPPSLEEAIEITKIYSAAGLNRNGLRAERPFRSPHQTTSPVAVIGGGQNPKPGEISLSHRGVLFLDELPEFRRDLLEALRQPLETGVAHVSRAKKTLQFPAKFTLIAAMNPCPCGYFGDTEKACRCTAHEVYRYQKKISGPLLDRIDIQINVPRLPLEELQKESQPTSGDGIRKKIAQARAIQKERFAKTSPRIHTNSEMSTKQCEIHLALGEKEKNFLKTTLEKSFISPRGYYRILKTARTIADLDGAERVTMAHLAEAFGYRLRQES